MKRHAVMTVPHWRYHSPSEAVSLRFMIRGVGQFSIKSNLSASSLES